MELLADELIFDPSPSLLSGGVDCGRCWVTVFELLEGLIDASDPGAVPEVRSLGLRLDCAEPCVLTVEAVEAIAGEPIPLGDSSPDPARIPLTGLLDPPVVVVLKMLGESGAECLSEEVLNEVEEPGSDEGALGVCPTGGNDCGNVGPEPIGDGVDRLREVVGSLVASDEVLDEIFEFPDEGPLVDPAEKILRSAVVVSLWSHCW